MKLLVLILLALLAAACGRKEEPRTTAAPTAPPVIVQTVHAEESDWPESYEATGSVRARISSVLSSKVMANVQQVSVSISDRVREGQPLVTLDAREFDSAVRRAEAARLETQSAIAEADQGIAGARANLEIAQATFRRIDELAGKKSVSNQELDEASARLAGARAAHEAARAKRAQLDGRLAQVDQEVRAASINREYTRIVAPFAGVVTAKSVEPGILAAPGVPLLTIEREGGYRLEASLEEARLPSIRVGQNVPVRLEALNVETMGRVSEIVPAVDPASRTYTVKLDLPALAGLRSGVFGRAIFPTAARKALTVPSGALVERGQLQQVFVVEDGRAHLRLITAGRRANGNVEALSGLSGGEQVIVPVPAGLADGARVEVRP
jgi:RND family efflux transporter MFP subunit